MDGQDTERMEKFLTVEHTTLQAARTALAAESNGRTSAFLGTISAGMVALALVFQIAHFSEVFLVFALILIPILCFVGISTYVRILHLDFADIAYTAAINRIRHFYLEAAPQIQTYLSFPANDDARSITRSRVIYTSYLWTLVSYPSGMILVVNNLLAGAFGSLLVTAIFHPQPWVAIVAGVVAFMVSGFIQDYLGLYWLKVVQKDFQPRFPAEEGKLGGNISI